MSALEDDYLTVDEAAALLRVAPSTVRRWIREGGVPAFRLGKRRIALRRTDLAALVTPLHPEHSGGGAVDGHLGEPEELTPEVEQRRAEAMAILEEIRRDNAKQRETFVERKLTDEEVRRGLQALEDAKRLSEEITARRGGKPFPPSWKLINQMRDERTRQLTGE